MAYMYKSIKSKLFNSIPLVILYYLSISEIDTHFSNMFDILSFNLQIIIIYYWTLKDEEILGNGHIFLAGIINDVVMGLPLGISSVSYLVVSFVGNYIKNVTVNFSIFTEWFTFVLAIFFSNLVFLTLIYNYSELKISYSEIFYNAFFTFLFFPAVWLIFNIYRDFIMVKRND